jgi:5'-nucleotidase
MQILIDQDGPLADFEAGFLERWQTSFPDEYFVSLVDRKTFKVRDDYPEELREKVESIYLSQGFYLNLGLVLGASEAVRELIRLGHEVWICTSPLSRNPHCVSEKYAWVENNFGPEFVSRLVVTKDKTLIRGQYLIDDNPKIDGRFDPEWEHVLFDAPYNRGFDNKPRITWATWREGLIR